MDTTQKTREDAAQRRPRQDSTRNAQKRPRGATPPASTQQRNGAARTAEQQRDGAAKPKKRPQQPAAKKQAAPKKQPAPKQKRPTRKTDPDDISNKKRAYGKSKPKKKTALSNVNDIFKRTVRESAAKKEKRTAKGGASRPKQPAPAVIYTQPQAFNRSRFLLQLATVTAVVVALVMGMSIFFKVETITVSGAEVYDTWAIREASGIKQGDNLLTFSQARAGALIKANLPYVRDVRFGIKLPDTVNIIVVEEDVVYAIKDQNGAWWLMNSEGRIVEQTTSGKASNYTQILGVTVEYPVANEKAIATENIPTETDASGEYAPITVTGAQRLNTTLQILTALEANGIVGDVASVDVAHTENIILWYGTRYQVNMGDSTRLEYKVACMNDVILQMSEWQSGVLDISFTTWPDQVGYTPFS